MPLVEIPLTSPVRLEEIIDRGARHAGVSANDSLRSDVRESTMYRRQCRQALPQQELPL